MEEERRAALHGQSPIANPMWAQRAYTGSARVRSPRIGNYAAVSRLTRRGARQSVGTGSAAHHDRSRQDRRFHTASLYTDAQPGKATSPRSDTVANEHVGLLRRGSSLVSRNRHANPAQRQLAEQLAAAGEDMARTEQFIH